MSFQSGQAYASGGALGGAAMNKFAPKGLMDFLFGTDFEKMDTMSPEQKQFFESIFGQLGEDGQLGQAYGQGMGNLQEMLDPSSAAYQRFEAPYMQQFNQETVPGLAERFAGAGAQGGALSSSGFGQALSSAGSNLQTQLAGMKSNLQRQAVGDIMSQYNSMAGMGMGAQPFGYKQPQQGFLPQMMAAGAKGAASAFSGGFGG